jgi:HK97 family phage prohead protease
MNLWERVQRGDVDQCSFGFDILEEETEWRQDDTVHWTVKRVKLYEVSPCTFPAYEETSLSARKAEAENIKKRQFDAYKIKNEARFKKWH